MKEGIHPKYARTIMKCACGATYNVGSTTKNVHVGICAACHPFFTGKQKLVDAEGRVEKFKKRYSEAPVVPPKPPKPPKAPVKAKAKPAPKAKPAAKAAAPTAAQPQA